MVKDSNGLIQSTSDVVNLVNSSLNSLTVIVGVTFSDAHINVDDDCSVRSMLRDTSQFVFNSHKLVIINIKDYTHFFLS